MKEVIGWIGGIIGVFLLIMLIGWVTAGNQFFMFKFFAPKVEQVRRETFEQSKAYRQGMIQELNNLQVDYIKATPEQKAGLMTIILHKAADVPPETLTPDLNAFLAQLRNERGQWKP
jgi:hypothetical protein